MSSKSQEEIILSSYNIFLDTGRSQGVTRGDQASISLAEQNINVANGQLIRLTVNDFCMAKSWSDVNYNNNALFFQSNITGTTLFPIFLAKQNYETINAIATNFASVLRVQLDTNTGSVYTASAILPGATTTINGTTDNIISFTLTCVGANALTTCGITCYEGKGDTNLIIGGDRIVDGTIIPAPVSITITVTLSGTNVAVQCLYPAQRSTTPYVYVRTNLTTNSIEQNSLTSPTDQLSLPDVLPSAILLRVPVNTEWCVYNSTSERVFYIDPNQNNISILRFYLTDEHSRPLGRYFGSEEKTATGTGLFQSTLGNLSFSMVVRIDIVQKRLLNERIFPDPLQALNTRMIGLRTTPATSSNYTST